MASISRGNSGGSNSGANSSAADKISDQVIEISTKSCKTDVGSPTKNNPTAAEQLRMARANRNRKGK